MKTTTSKKPKRVSKTAAPAKAGAGRATRPDIRPAVGSKAPPFSLPVDTGGTVSLADHKGKWVVLYFYPKDNTPGCTREAIGFEGAAAALKKRGAVVLGVSRDSIASHCSFKEKQRLRFPLLSDPTAEVHKRYGAFGEKTLYGRKMIGTIRTTALIRPDGTVARIFSNVKVDGHVDSVLAAIDEEKKSSSPSSSRV